MGGQEGSRRRCGTPNSQMADKASRRRKGAHCRFAQATGTAATPNLVDGGFRAAQCLWTGPAARGVGTAAPRAPNRKPWVAVSMSHYQRSLVLYGIRLIDSQHL